MSTSTRAQEVVEAAYAAFGRGDVPAILDLVADTVDWRFHGDTEASGAARA